MKELLFDTITAR